MECHNQGQTAERLGRYLSHWKFERVLRDRALYLSPLRRFTDQYEGFIHPEYFNQLKSAIMMNPCGGMDQGEQQTLYTAENAIRHIKDSTFVSCWTTHSTPSAHLWEEYLLKDLGVFVLVQKEALINNLRIAVQTQGLNFQSGIVTYNDLSELPFEYQSYGWERLRVAPEIVSAMGTGDFLFHKSLRFEFEQEYRLIGSRNYGIDFKWWRESAQHIGAEYASMGVLNHVRIDSPEEYEQAMASSPPEGILMKVNLEEIVCEIVVRPGASDDYLKDVHQLIIDSGLEALRTKLTVSEL